MDELFAEAVRVIAQEHGLDAGPILQALGPRAKALLEADDWDALEAAVLEAGGQAGRGAAADGVTTRTAGAATESDDSSGAYLWPIAGQTRQTATITNPFGAKQVRAPGFTGNLPATNNGLDIGAKAGTSIVAPVSGKVIQVYRYQDPESGNDFGYGNSVRIEGDNGWRYRLSHMQYTPDVRLGDRVEQGQQLGLVGQTGNATGDHLDLEVQDASGRFIDPLKLFGQGQGAQGTGQGQGAGSQKTRTELLYDDAVKRHESASQALDRAIERRSTLRTKMASGTVTTEEALEYQNIEKEVGRLTTEERTAFSQVTSLAGRLQSEGKPATWLTRSLPRGGIIQINPLTGEQRVIREQDAAGTNAGPRTFQGDDGRQYVLSADGKTAVPVEGQGRKPYTANHRAYPVDPTTGLPDTTKMVDLLTELERDAADFKARQAMAEGQYTTGRGELTQTLQRLTQAGAITDDQAAAQVAAYDRLWEPVAQRLAREQEERQKRAQDELERHNREQEELAKSGERRQIADLAAELGSNAAGSAIFLNRGRPQAAQAALDRSFPASPEAPNESVGMRVLRSMGLAPDAQTGLLGRAGQAQPPQPQAPAVAGVAALPPVMAQPAVPTTEATPAAPLGALGGPAVPSDDEDEQRRINPFRARFMVPATA